MKEAAKQDYDLLTKAQLQDLLTERNIEWTKSLLKPELVNLAKGSE